MAKAQLRIKVTLPWYWRGYVWAARVAHMLGIPVDPAEVAAAILRRSTFRAE